MVVDKTIEFNSRPVIIYNMIIHFCYICNHTALSPVLIVNKKNINVIVIIMTMTMTITMTTTKIVRTASLMIVINPPN